MRGSFRSRPVRAAVGCAALLAVAAVAIRIWRRAPAAPHSWLAAAPIPPVRTPPAREAWPPNYDSIAYEADPAAIVAGRVSGLAVVDSVTLGARSVALLVRAGPADVFMGPTHHVILASDSGPVRTFRKTPMVGIGRLPKGLGFGAVDVDGDGVREPYVAAYRAGTGGYDIDISVLNPRGRATIDYEFGGSWGDLEDRRGALSSDSEPAGSRTLRFLDRHARRIADYVDAEAYNPETLREHRERREWKRRHGVDFYQGPVQARWHPGKVPFQAGACRIPDDRVTWVASYALWAYDPARNRHFLAWLPSRDEIDPASTMLVGRRYVWLGSTVRVAGGYGLLAYDKERGRLLAVPVPGLKPKFECGEDLCPGPLLSVSGGRLRADSTELTLPARVDPERELAGAKSCRS